MRPDDQMESSVRDAERKRLVAEVVAANHPHMVSHIRAMAELLPNYPAISFLDHGEEPVATLTFCELDRKARSLAAWFQRRGAQGARAIMLFDAGVELLYAFLGCAYGRVIGVPMPAPTSSKLDRYLVRVQNVILDGDARFVLTTSAIRDRLRAITLTMQGFEHIEWVAVDELDDLSSAWMEEAIDTSELVYLQYTSGSTSIPKGVMVTHRNVMSAVRYMGHVGEYMQRGTAAVCWMPYFHDFGMIDGLLVPLAYGVPVYLMSPFDFVQHPMRWINAIHRFRASHSAGPNFSFDLVARKSTEAERAALDLSCWHRANNCAEPIRWNSVQRFLQAFGPCGFAVEAMAPLYGLAEATLPVSMAHGAPQLFCLEPEAFEQHRVRLVAENEPARHLVGCGQVFTGTWQVEVRIVNPDTREPTPEGEVGEVWVHGDVVAKGYWNKPVETDEKFCARIVGDSEREFLRTGDMGFLLGKELVITGRRKDLIIVEGRNHYPQDIEATAEKALPCLRRGCSIVFSVETEEQPAYVVLVCELSSGFMLAEDAGADSSAIQVVERKELERAIRREVSDEHQLRVHDIVFLTPGLLPKTTSGKVERSGCRARYINGALKNAVPRR